MKKKANIVTDVITLKKLLGTESPKLNKILITTLLSNLALIISIVNIAITDHFTLKDLSKQTVEIKTTVEKNTKDITTHEIRISNIENKTKR